MKKIFLLTALLFTLHSTLFTLHSSLSTCLAQTTRETSYGRKDQNVTLDLNWTGDNYGTIQWQKSTDNGATWTDISGKNGSTYTVKLTSTALYRAHIVGDPSCPEINIEREVKAMSFTTSVDENYWNGVKMSVTSADFQGADIVEYGYATNLGALGRSFDMLPLTKVGDRVPEGDFSFDCLGLRPNTNYSMRFYVKTADGSVIFGPGKIANTTAGIEFSSEDWTIEKKRLRAQFMLSGDGEAKDVTCQYGTSLDNMKTSNVTSLGSGKYRSAYMSSLTPGTTYYIKVKATVDNEEQEIIKEIKTLTDYSTYTVDETVIPVSHKINWGTKRVLTKLTDDSHGGFEYPRMCRIDENTILFTYHAGTSSDQWLSSYYRISHDNGETWDAEKTIFDKTKTFCGSAYYRICNPQATLLDNGWVILSAVANGNPENNNNCKVICVISKDKCKTWSDPIIVGRGRTWEPHVMQLPGGELELLVSSEAQWWANGGSDQEIVFARSTDYGQTWTAFERASYLQGGRDGMPVPVVMQGNKGVLYTIESPAAGTRPSVVHRDLNAEWDTTPWDRQDDANRWATGLNGGGGAPYCVQLPTGEFVMTAHTNQVGQVWQTCRPQVIMTDNTGHNPKNITLPCITGNPLNSDEGAYYNSLFVKDAQHIWLLVTRATYSGSTRGKSSIEFIEGTIK